MGELVPILWAKQSAHDKSGKATCERLYNCFLEPNPEGSLTPFKIIGCPGLKFWSTFGAGPIRGQLFSPDLNKMFVVSGNALYVVSSDGSGINVGTIPGGGPVAMCANSTQVLICTNLGTYYATTAAVFNVDGNHYSSCTYQDGYGICVLFGTNQFYITGIDDFSTIGALDFTSADSYTGIAHAVISCNKQVVIFGQTTVTPYYNSGAALFPFAAVSGGVVQIGTLAPQSPTLLQDAIGWLAHDKSVQIWRGGQHQVVSTPGIEAWIAKRLNPGEARGMRYRQEGHDFYVLNFQDGSIAVDTITGEWHDRGSWNQTRWLPDSSVPTWGMELAGDSTNGNIYQLDTGTYTEETSTPGTVNPLVRQIQPSPIHGNGNRVIMDEVRLNSEPGTAVDNYNPQWGLDWSDDHGNTWGNQLLRSAGKVGEYKDIARWNRLGQFRERTLRFSYTHNSRMAALGAFARMDLCNG